MSKVIHELVAQVQRWDAEGETIERGRAAWRPVRPAGEPSFSIGSALLVAAWIIMTIFGAAVS